ncbi:hypothetical protein KM427_19475 [Nocardioides sp. LMS-CY]|uniref:hypothetical protein n=1 Tax=Nocardioides sp. (strain LMS-CY) TaxID=2840457 RepID=UPI001C008EAF|nr:hypothetical protein [Nocardioides sp. LMS-CY]QWF21107.1 hypothetical protein KM427_19475 [Nocardioides sp. LMS-CY]
MRVLGALLAVVVAVGVGLFAGLVPGHHAVPPEVDFDDAILAAAAQEPPGDRVQAAIDGVRETGFYVGPELRDELTDDEVATVERIIATAPVPVFVVWWADTADAGYNTTYAALDQLRVGVGEDGYYAVVTRGSYPLLGALGYRDPYVDADGKGRAGAALERLVEELAAVPPERDFEGGDTRSDYWGGTGGGIAAGLLFAAIGYLGLLAVVGLVGALSRSAREGRA